MSTTSARVGSKIKNLTKASEMWEVVKADATTKSTLADIKQHFQLMVQRRENLIKMGGIVPFYTPDHYCE